MFVLPRGLNSIQQCGHFWDWRRAKFQLAGSFGDQPADCYVGALQDLWRPLVRFGREESAAGIDDGTQDGRGYSKFKIEAFRVKIPLPSSLLKMPRLSRL